MRKIKAIKDDKELPSDIAAKQISTIHKEVDALQKQLRFLERKGLKLVKLSIGDIYDMALIQAYISKLKGIQHSVFVSPGSLMIKMDERGRKGQLELRSLNDWYGEFDIPTIDEEKELNAIEDIIY